MTSTAQDYTWFADQFPAVAEAYCITLVRGRTPDEVLQALEAEDQTTMTGLDSVHEAAMDTWDLHGGLYLFVAVTTVGEYALMVESNGYVGVTPELSMPLSSGTRLVTHFKNVNAEGRFCWMEDQDLRLDFDPLFAHQRDGSGPDGLVDVMQQVGFDFSGDFTLCWEAAFALAGHLTHAQLTPELL